jgi:hypothetical protein
MTKFYAIRQKSTGMFLPRIGSNRSNSYREPTNDLPPWLALKRGTANMMLTVWLKGHARQAWSAGSDTWLGREDPEPRGVDYKPVPGRVREDFEVVEVSLVLE